MRLKSGKLKEDYKLKNMKFDYSKFTVHVHVFRQKLEAEDPKIRLSMQNIADGMKVSHTILSNTMTNRSIPRADHLQKMCSYMGHDASEYFIPETDE